MEHQVGLVSKHAPNYLSREGVESVLEIPARKCFEYSYNCCSDAIRGRKSGVSASDSGERGFEHPDDNRSLNPPVGIVIWVQVQFRECALNGVSCHRSVWLHSHDETRARSDASCRAPGPSLNILGTESSRGSVHKRAARAR